MKSCTVYKILELSSTEHTEKTITHCNFMSVQSHVSSHDVFSRIRIHNCFCLLCALCGSVVRYPNPICSPKDNPVSAPISTPTLEATLKVPFPSYHRPLAWAHQWLSSGDPERKRVAVELLRTLYQRYDHAVAVGQELVLALMESGREAQPEAEATLQGIDARFAKLDEELLCRWGRFYKDHGDRYLGLPWLVTEIPPNPEEARPYYLRSLEKYEEAFRIRSGHYPGINTATLQFLLGTLARPAGTASSPEGNEVAKAQAIASRLLEGREKWSELTPKDRTIWHPATAAEAHLLLQEWDPAAREYRVAIENSRGALRDIESIGRQVCLIVMGWSRVGVAIPEPFTQLHLLFPSVPRELIILLTQF